MRKLPVRFFSYIGIVCLWPVVLVAQEIPNAGVDLQGLSTNYHGLRFADLDGDAERQVVVDREAGQYLGHPSSVLLDDGQTILCAYPKGHGRGAIVLKRSEDGGKTWSDRLDVPASWASSLEVPTLFKVEDAAGTQRLVMFSGLFPARMAISEDEGRHWSALDALGNWGGIVVMGDLIALHSGKGHYMALFHDDQRFISHRGRPKGDEELARANMPLFTLFKTFSFDGGLSWSEPEPVFSSRMVHLCEPGLIRSPDGRQIAMLLRENSRRMNSFIMFSDDEGKSWSPPRQLPNALTGDRHQALYLPDGRLLISFRDNSPAPSRLGRLRQQCPDCDPRQLAEQAGPASPTHGDWVAWIGSWEDLEEGGEGQWRIRLKDNTRGSDCAYPALELLPDGTVVAITYGHWADGAPPYILEVRLRGDEFPPPE